MLRLALATLRYRTGGFAASFVAVFLGATIVMGFAALLDTALGVTGESTPLPEIAEHVQLAFQAAGYDVRLDTHDDVLAELEAGRSESERQRRDRQLQAWRQATPTEDVA